VGAFLPKRFGSMHASFNSCLEACAWLVNFTSSFCLVSTQTRRTLFDSSLSKVSPTPNGRTPGILSAATSPPP
jgi:hypothetical protein